MTQVLEITHDNIGQLTDFQLTDLLRRLLHLEASHFNIASRSVTVSLNITVADGGEDGRVEWSDIGKYLSSLRQLDPVIVFKAGFEPQLCAPCLSIPCRMRALGMTCQIRDSGL